MAKSGAQKRQYLSALTRKDRGKVIMEGPTTPLWMVPFPTTYASFP